MTSLEYERAVRLYKTVGIRPIIQMVGTTTRYGGTILHPDARKAMDDASGALVDLNELIVKSGETIARMLGAEAAVVTSGAAGGLLVQAAAVMAGTDPGRIASLPNTDGMKNEIIMQKAHRMGYDQCYRAAGATIVDVGYGSSTEPWQLESAISEKTAAVAHIVSPGNGGRGMKLEPVLEIAHKHDVPVIVDAASTLPPRDNLFKFTRASADLVVYSGGKGIRGPQGTGIVVGRPDLVEAARLNHAPHGSIGRAGKVSKEEIMGLIAALGAFLQGDEDAEMADYRKKCEDFNDQLVEVPGIRLTVEQDDVVYLVPNAVVYFESSWTGREPAEIVEALMKGDPPVYCKEILGGGRGLAFYSFNPTHEEMQIAAGRVREELLVQ